MLTLDEIKEWLRIDGEDDDITLNSLLTASKFIIKQATGVTPEDVENNTDANELYKLIQRIIIADNYENRFGSNNSSMLIGYYTQLESYKLVGEL